MQTVEPVVPAETIRRSVRSGKYLAFNLGKEMYGLHVSKVREIVGYQETASVPYTPSYVRGVINLRGKLIPVVDLRMKFGLDGSDHNERTCVIVVQVPGEHDTFLLGVVVDGVSEVLTFAESEIEDTPDFGDGAADGAILGIAKGKNGIYVLLDIDRVLGRQELRSNPGA
ncbi:MAG TPA: chemotaxis protein CheW [Bryobacteraceae bacterium]|nr:chemotaxis protein CheW [Bryobacteraceae bacterium]